MLPSEIPKLPTDPPVRGFPGVWKLPLLRLPPRDGSPSLTLLSFILPCIFCPADVVAAAKLLQSCPTLYDPMNCSTPDLPVHHQLPESTQTHAQWIGDAIQPSHPLLSPSPPAHNLSQHQGLFKWVSSSHQVAKVLEFQPQHQSFQWTPRTDLL